jgi:hypothetical protein
LLVGGRWTIKGGVAGIVVRGQQFVGRSWILTEEEVVEGMCEAQWYIVLILKEWLLVMQHEGCLHLDCFHWGRIWPPL